MAFDKFQCARDIEAIEETAANTGHQAIERDADSHDVGPRQRNQRQILGAEE